LIKKKRAGKFDILKHQTQYINTDISYLYMILFHGEMVD